MKKPSVANYSLKRLIQKINQGLLWDNGAQEHQVKLLQKIFAKYGLVLILTCGACPEQYDVLKDGKQVAYFRLRHGEFRVDYPDVRGKVIYSVEPMGDGIFHDTERLAYMTKAMRVLLEFMETSLSIL